MKKLFAMAALVSLAAMLTACFKPEPPKNNEDVEALLGYWEVVHVSDDDYEYEVFADGSHGPKISKYKNSAAVRPNDGNEEYAVVRFTEAYVILIASDCIDHKPMLNVPLSYRYVDGKLYDGFGFTDFETGLEYTGVTVDKDIMYLSIIENYPLGDDGQTYGTYAYDTRKVTLRRIE